MASINVAFIGVGGMGLYQVKSFLQVPGFKVVAGADMVLLDNMNLAQLKAAVEKCRGRAKTEASGGVNLATVRAIAETGVDFISVGALTHSARAVDIGLDFSDG